MKIKFVFIIFFLLASPIHAARRPAQVSSPAQTDRDFFFGLGFATYSEKRSVQRETGDSVPAYATTVGKAIKLEYALRQKRRGFRLEGFLLLNTATVQSADPSISYHAGNQDHTAWGASAGPYYHFASIATTVGLSLPLFYRALDVKNSSTVSSLEKGTILTWGALLDLRWRLNSPLYLEQKLGYLSTFSGPYWLMALDYQFL